MIGRKKKIGNDVKQQHEKRRMKIENSYLVLALIGAVLLAVLVFIQTRFTTYMRMDHNGLAVLNGTVTSSLELSPDSEDISETVELYSFNAMDYLFAQGEKFFFGEKQKRQIDGDYPVYLNHGASVQMVNNKGTLLTPAFEKVSTYKGLILTDGIAYNTQGDRADAAEYIFIELRNGNYVNLKDITYHQRGQEKNIAKNSLIRFEKDWFAYYEITDDSLIYKYFMGVPGDLSLNIGGMEISYDELLKALGVTSEKEDVSGTEDMQDTEETDGEDTEVQEAESDVTVEEQKPARGGTSGDGDGQPGKKGEDGRQNMGVRPDSMRPDKNPDNNEDKPPKPVQGYVKPEVTLGSWTPEVYRIMADLTVKDPADRIDVNKQIQFEVYEIGKNGEETLRFRSYRTAGGTVELGSGNIAPGTTYRIVSFFTYFDEYDQSVTESLGEQVVTTKGFDTLGEIHLVQQPGTAWHNRIEIAGLGFGDGSDLEAVYGIDRSAGITLTVIPVNHVGNGTVLKLNASQIARFKGNTPQDITTMSVLQAKTQYEYEFTAQDYFGNPLKLTNAAGIAFTSNHAPEASIKVSVNEIDHLELSMSVTDVDAAAVAREGSDAECDIYVAVTAGRRDLGSAAELSDAVWSHKLTDADYTWTPESGLSIRDLALPVISGLDLDTRYFATVYCDYDLSNGKGPQRFMNIGQLGFTSAGISSLGRVYITSEVSDITCESAFVKFKLNNLSTNPELSKLITRVEMNVMTGEGDDLQLHASVGFDKNTTAVNPDTGDTEKVYEQFRRGDMIGFPAQKLSSMTDYTLEAHVFAEYNGKEYELVVSMISPDFKTLRKPAQVTVDGLLFAAGELVFDARVDDPDEAVTGYSGDKVIVNLYTQDGTFVRATRISKNTDVTVTFRNLDVNRKYELRFLAVEYNEGYDNTTFESNKVLYTLGVDEAMRLSGAIKLTDILAVTGDDAHYTANVRASLEDPDHYLTGTDAMPYYISIEKDGAYVDTGVYRLDTESADGAYENIYSYQVDRGEYTYKLTLYVMVNGRQMVLDTLEFTTEAPVKGFWNAYQMIRFIKDNPYGKFVAVNDITMSSQDENYETEGDTASRHLSGNNITGIFHGQIDFQGYTLNHHLYTRGQELFDHVGPGARVENMVYRLYMYNTTNYNDSGGFCYRNFGTFRNIYAQFMGTDTTTSNSNFGMICRVNAATGIIEYFVVKNDPEEDRYAFRTGGVAGLVTATNHGTIRYGYAYGEDIELPGVPTNNVDRQVGGIAGQNGALGRIQNVYSMIRITMADRSSESPSKPGETWNRYYGSVSGNNGGTVRNVYGIGEHVYHEDKALATNPVVQGGRLDRVYYWNDRDYTYSNTSVKRVTTETLWDVSWQRARLGAGFDTDPVQVGYYPHVIWSGDMPEQEYLPLPGRQTSGDVEISRTEVLDYFDMEDGTQAARVMFVFSNKEGLTITGLDIEDLTVRLDASSAETEDGYTTMTGVVSDPQSFVSEYSINAIEYIKNNRNQRYDLASPYLLSVDFYRYVSSADEWYDYVVQKAKAGKCENVRLTSDIDFADVDAGRIMVTANFTAKLDGNGKTLSNINLQRGFRNRDNNTRRNLFTATVTGNAQISDLTVENYSCGGVYTDGSGVTYVARDGALCYQLQGHVADVHIRGLDNDSYGVVGGIAAQVSSAGEIADCTVSASDAMGVDFTYVEPMNANSIIAMGGIAGSVSSGRISHCLVTDLTMNADAMKGSNGVGGVAGYAGDCVIDTAYAQGSITTRASRVGGIAGAYASSGPSLACVKNVWAKVDIICHTDMAGELIGYASVNDVITPTNNMSGLAVGSVYASNPDAEHVGRTVGGYNAKTVAFYGTQMQLMNGATGEGIPDNEKDRVRGLLSYEQLTEDAYNTYRNIVGFENVYSMDRTSEGYLPKMYYEGSRTLLPNQKDIELSDAKEYDLEVRNVFVNTNNRVVTVELWNPDQYKITGLDIDDLNWNYVKSNGSGWSQGTVDEASDYSGSITRIYLQYDVSQEHFLDSYVLRSIRFYTEKNSSALPAAQANLNAMAGRGSIHTLACYARIGVTLYRDIDSVADWNRIPGYPEYENYRLTSNLDFSDGDFAKNLNISRLVGMGDKSISGAVVTGSNTNLIARLNSGMEHITIKDSTLSTNTNDCIGFIGISSGKIEHCSFENLVITPKTGGKNYVGVIGHQNGNGFTDIRCSNITVNASTTSAYVGALCGYVRDISTFKDLTGSNLTVKGRDYTGGMFGYLYNTEIDHVELTDINVSGGAYTGGFAGRLGDGAQSQYKRVTNISITGTPESDGAVMTGSSTTISGYTSVGGVAGQMSEATGSADAKAEDGAYVAGCHIKGSGNNIGGVYGNRTDWGSTRHLKVSDSLIQAVAKNNTLGTNVGGVVGQNSGAALTWAEADHVRVEAWDHRNVGGIIGAANGHGSSWMVCRNGVVQVRKSQRNDIAAVGGVIGETNAGVSYSGAINTVVDAPDASFVGGFAGKQGTGIGSGSQANACYSIAEPDSTMKDTLYAAEAKQNYYVKGKTWVGGFAGGCYGIVSNSYSNLNVQAVGGGGAAAGGLAGYYANYYNRYLSGSVWNITYGTASLRHCYFAGSVTSDDYAGGTIGRTGLLYKGQSAAGSRNGTGTPGETKTGAKNEAEYTYGNIVIASTIDGKAGHTGNFASDDVTLTGRNNRLWDGTTVNGTSTSQLMSGGSYLYSDTWQPTQNAFDLKGQKLELFSSKNLESNADWNDRDNWYIDGSGTQTGLPVALLFWRNMGWSCKYSGDASLHNLDRNFIWRVSAYQAYDRYEPNTGATAGRDDGNYLPQVRSSSTLRYSADNSIAYQNEIGRLPIPQYADNGRPALTGYSMREETADTYGVIYGSDVDSVNLEFSENLLDTGFYTLKCGNVTVAKEKIRERVCTLPYDYSDKLTLTYGTLQDASLAEEELWEPENLIIAGELTVSREELARSIMVYGNDYYYIGEEGVVSSAGTHAGSYRTLMNGKALDTSGNIYRVSDWTLLGTAVRMTDSGTVSGGAGAAKALAEADYEGWHISTYARCTRIDEGGSSIYRNDQIFVRSGELYAVPGELENQKDGILLYALNGEEYMTILGNDGIMADMLQAKANIPEEVENKAIVRMTNTLKANVPYVIVEYANGGMVGYNYATGEILFDNSVESETSLLDYAKNFFAGDSQSMYHGVSSSYSANADLSKRIHSEADLERIVGNNSGEYITGRGTGEDTGTADPGSSAPAGDNTAAADPGNTGQSEGGSGSGNAPGTDTGADSLSGSSQGGAGGAGDAAGSDGAGDPADASGGSLEAPGDIVPNTSGGAGGASGDGAAGSDDMLTADQAASTGRFMTVYNPQTGLYEIVSVDRYLTDEYYVSENERLGIEDLPGNSGFAESSLVDRSQENGIVMYILAAGLVVLLISGVVLYARKKRKV